MTNVSSQSSGKWTDQVTVSFSQQAYCASNHTAWKWTNPRVGPAQVTLTVSGNFTTWLGYTQYARAIDNNGTLTINWTNSMRAAVHLVSIDMPGSGYRRELEHHDGGGRRAVHLDGGSADGKRFSGLLHQQLREQPYSGWVPTQSGSEREPYLDRSGTIRAVTSPCRARSWSSGPAM